MVRSLIVVMLNLVLITPLFPSAAIKTMSLEETESITKKIVYNGSERELFARWFKRTARSDTAVPVSKVEPIASNSWSIAKQPQDAKNLWYVLSFARENVESSTLDWTQKDQLFAAFKAKDVAAEEKCNVFTSQPINRKKNQNDEQVPRFCTNMPLISVLNTTNKTVYCAPYSFVPRKSNVLRSITATVALEPQSTHVLAFENANDKLLFSAQEKELSRNLMLSQVQDFVTVDAPRADSMGGNPKEHLVLPAINDAQGPTAQGFIVTDHTDADRAFFLIDEIIKSFHQLPALTATEKVELEKEIRAVIESHDSHLADPDEVLDPVTERLLSELPGEQEFIKRRKAFVQRKLKKLFAEELADQDKLTPYGLTKADFDDLELLPTIAFVTTGGGCRAMVATTGFLEGAQMGHILGCCMYLCGLSGSSWAINSFVASNLSIRDFANSLGTRIVKKSTPTSMRTTLTRIAAMLPENSPYLSLFHLIFALSESDSYKRTLFVQEKFNQTQGFVGLYGHALAEAFLSGYEVNGKKSPHSITLSDLQANLSNNVAKYPLPISVCLHSPAEVLSRYTRWFEFSPYNIGTYSRNKFSGWHIPTKAFGSHFKNGRITSRCPEYPLGQLFGTFGSAMALSAESIKMGIVKVSPEIQRIINMLSSNHIVLRANEPRFTAGVMPNFLYCPRRSFTVNPELFSHKKLRLIDGGLLSLPDGKEGYLCHNFATIPALQRQCDILILTDCNSYPNGAHNTEHLKAAYSEASDLGFELPPISDKQSKALKTNNYSTLLESDRPRVPSLVYIPLKGNDKIVRGFDPDSTVNELTKTEHFRYGKDTYTNLRNLSKGLFADPGNVDNIKKAILRAMSNKKNLRPPAPSVATPPADIAPTNITQTSPREESPSRNCLRHPLETLKALFRNRNQGHATHDDDDNDTDVDPSNAPKLVVNWVDAEESSDPEFVNF